jgi:hypothetical protein
MSDVACNLNMFQVPIIANPNEWSVLKSVIASYHLAPRYDIARDNANTDSQISIYVMPSRMNAAKCLAHERTPSGMRSPDRADRTAGIGFSFTVSCKDTFSNQIGKSAFYKALITTMYPVDLHDSNSILGSTSRKTVPQSVQRGAGVNSGTWSIAMHQEETAGVYIVTVMTLGGEHIQSSPFQVTVFPSNHCAARSFVSGTFLSLYTVNSFCTFSVIARDRFYNTLTTGEFVLKYKIIWHAHVNNLVLSQRQVE